MPLVTSTGAWNISGRWPGHPHVPPDAGVGHSLRCLLGEQSVVDIGAGAGQYGAFFGACSGRRPKWSGFDGALNVEAISATGPPGAFTRHVDLCDANVDVGRHDWAMSLEVAEHLPSHCLPGFIALFNRSARVGVVLSWGQDQRGRGHISPRRPAEVEQLMSAYGWFAAVNLSRAVGMTAPPVEVPCGRFHASR